MKDVQNTPDTRGIAIDQVGVCDLTYPITVLDRENQKQQGAAKISLSVSLPYRGLGSGIKRALADWPDIAFTDDRNGCQFTAAVARKPATASETGLPETAQKTTQKILEFLARQPTASRQEIADVLGGITQDGIKYHLGKLKAQGILKRIGPDKGGYWKVVSQ